MKPIQTPECDGILTAPPGMPECGNLPFIRAFHEGDPASPTVTSLWQPDPEELALISRGVPVALVIWGQTHPPVYVGAANRLPDSPEVKEIPEPLRFLDIKEARDFPQSAFVVPLAEARELLRQRDEAQFRLYQNMAREAVECGWCKQIIQAPPGFSGPLTVDAIKEATRLHLATCPCHPVRETDAELAKVREELDDAVIEATNAVNDIIVVRARLAEAEKRVADLEAMLARYRVAETCDLSNEKLSV